MVSPQANALNFLEERRHLKDIADADAIAQGREKTGWPLEGDDENDPSADMEMEWDESNGTTTEKEKKGEMMEEEDPLDAFMSGIKRELSVATIPVEKGEVLENEDNFDMLVVVDDVDVEAATASLRAKDRLLLPETDHSKVHYRPFRKNFYSEVPAVAAMSRGEVAELRHELDGIKVRGSDVPTPIKTWPQCGVHPRVLAILKKKNCLKPTPIQSQAVPAIMSGHDVVGVAKTGSGKTLAFLVPMFRHVVDADGLDEDDGPIAIVVSPTRELAIQTAKETRRFARPLNLRVVGVCGGVDKPRQIADLKRGAEIVVCTPGRMIDMLAARVTNLRRCTYVVIDEADRMFDMGFEPQVRAIVSNIRPDAQRVLFSATFPRAMEALGRSILHSPIEIDVGGRSVVCEDVRQHAVVVEEHQKLLKLLELLGAYNEEGRIIVFVDRQERADEVTSTLRRHGYSSCATLHGGMDQSDRDSSINHFRDGTVRVLVATSVAARGLDVRELVLVVNFDCPSHFEDYVHRVGRTGRAGCKGTAYTFVLPKGQERMAGVICKAFETAGVRAPSELKKMFDGFKSEMETRGKRVRLGGRRGFDGSGYTFDEKDEASQRKMGKLMGNGLEDEGMDSLIYSKSVDATTSGVQWSKRVEVRQPSKITASEEPIDIRRIAALARARAVQLAKRLSRIEGPPREKEHFEEELDVNDLPLEVRRRICSRDVRLQICDMAEVGMTITGTYCPSGKETKDRRLTIRLQARDELQLKRAKDEIMRIVKETIRQLVQRSRGGLQGRYKV